MIAEIPNSSDRAFSTFLRIIFRPEVGLQLKRMTETDGISIKIQDVWVNVGCYVDQFKTFLRHSSRSLRTNYANAIDDIKRKRQRNSRENVTTLAYFVEIGETADGAMNSLIEFAPALEVDNKDGPPRWTTSIATRAGESRG